MPDSTGSTGDGGALAYGVFFVQTMAALGALGLVSVVARRWVNRWRPAEPAAPGLRIVERLALEPRRCLYLVEGPNLRLLVAASEQGLQCLGLWHEGSAVCPTAAKGWPRIQRSTRRATPWPGGPRPSRTP